MRENLYNTITKLVTREFCCMEILLIVIGRTKKKGEEEKNLSRAKRHKRVIVLFVKNLRNVVLIYQSRPRVR